MPSLSSEVLVGVTVGGLAAVAPTAIVSVLALVVERVTGRRVRARWIVPAVIVLTIPVALFVGLIDLAAFGPVRILAGLGTAGLVGLAATSQTHALADLWPRAGGDDTRREPGLSASVAENIDAAGCVTIAPSGPIDTLDTFREVSETLSRDIAAETWRLPADLPIEALETRVEDRLRSEYDLPDARVDIDRQGRASIAVAPPDHPIGRTLRDGARAMTIETRLPASIAEGERVHLYTGTDTVEARVIGLDGTETVANDRDPGPTGDRPVTLEIDAADAGTVLEASTVRLGVPARTGDDDAAAMALLERAGRTVRRTTLDEDDIERLDEAGSCHPIAVRDPVAADATWQFDRDPRPGDEAFVIGDPVVVAEIDPEGSA